MLQETGAVDRLVPCQGPGVEGGVERSLPGSDPRARAGGLRHLSARAFQAGYRRAADAGAPQDGRGVRRRKEVHPESGSGHWSAVRMTRRTFVASSGVAMAAATGRLAIRKALL